MADPETIFVWYCPVCEQASTKVFWVHSTLNPRAPVSACPGNVRQMAMFRPEQGLTGTYGRSHWSKGDRSYPSVWLEQEYPPELDGKGCYVVSFPIDSE